MKRRFVASIALTGALVAAACGTGSDSGAPGANEAADGATPDAQVFDGLEGEFALIDGETIDLAELGEQDVVLWFWAPW